LWITKYIRPTKDRCTKYTKFSYTKCRDASTSGFILSGKE
jgi:hypothetical protein